MLVVQRSDEVRTYPGKWGGVSGGVEGSESLLSRALVEINEEVGYSADQITLVRSGRPLFVDDGELRFAVHPFLFSLAADAHDAAPQLNWENVQAVFVKPESLASLETVPLLTQTLDRLLLNSWEEAALRRIAEDRTHGAAELAKQALCILEGVRRSSSPCRTAFEPLDLAPNPHRSARQAPHPNILLVARADKATMLCEDPVAQLSGFDLVDGLRTFSFHLGNCRPSMAPVANTLVEVLAALHASLHARADAFECAPTEVARLLKDAIAEEWLRLDGLAAALRRHVQALLKDGTTLMTLSLSSTVRDAVATAASTGTKLSAIVCESRPLCEGAALANAWAEAGVDVSIVTEAQAAFFMPRVDLVLVGADALESAGAVNKVGTRMLALAAGACGVPMIVAADSSKLQAGTLFSLAHPGGDSEPEPEEKSGDELRGAWPAPLRPEIRVRNVYFERVPLALLSVVVTEHGPLDAANVERGIQRLRALYTAAFFSSLSERQPW